MACSTEPLAFLLLGLLPALLLRHVGQGCALSLLLLLLLGGRLFLFGLLLIFAVLLAIFAGELGVASQGLRRLLVDLFGGETRRIGHGDRSDFLKEKKSE